MKIIVVGPGCPRCKATEENVKKACKELNLQAEITHVYDVKEFPKLGVMMTPAVLVDNEVIISGKVPTVQELKEILSKKI